MENYKKPYEIIDYTINAGLEKANRDFFKLVLLGFLAGVSIAFGSVGNILVGANLRFLDSGLAKFFGASVFPVGLIMIVILGFELFTSNCLIAIAVLDKKTSFKKMIRNWIIVYISNLIGALFVAYISVKTHSFGENGLLYLESLAQHKVEASALDIILKGILCNILVCGGVLVSYSAKDIISKIFGIWFPIMLFIILGYDHCVANMLYLPAALIAHLNISLNSVIHNIFFATIGNIIGGSLIMSYFLYFSLHKDER